MKCLNKKWKCACRECGRVHLVDKCLIVIMAILLLQSAYSLIVHEGGTALSGDIDTIVRTSAASIFGYFLSANFIRRDNEKQEVGSESLEQEQDQGHFMVSGRLQILIAAGIGGFCLLTLILVRDMEGITNVAPPQSAVVTVTQFRDFVSGCVGYLIGCPTSGKKSEGS